MINGVGGEKHDFPDCLVTPHVCHQNQIPLLCVSTVCSSVSSGLAPET